MTLETGSERNKVCVCRQLDIGLPYFLHARPTDPVNFDRRSRRGLGASWRPKQENRVSAAIAWGGMCARRRLPPKGTTTIKTAKSAGAGAVQLTKVATTGVVHQFEQRFSIGQ